MFRSIYGMYALFASAAISDGLGLDCGMLNFVGEIEINMNAFDFEKK